MGRGPSTICNTLAEMMRGPGTLGEITTRVGNKTSTQISKQIKTMQNHGLVYVRAWKRNTPTGPWMAVWEVQTTPCEFKDAPRPPPKPQHVKDAEKKLKQEAADAVEDDAPRIVIDAARGVTRHNLMGAA